MSRPVDGEALLKKLSFIALTNLILLTFCIDPVFAHRRIIDVDRTRERGLVFTTLTVQDGPDPRNRFLVHRVRRSGRLRGGAIMVLPPLGNNFGFYTFAEPGAPRGGFAATFARSGFDVWGYSPRETGIAADDCGTTIDCSIMDEWGLRVWVRDVAFIRNLVRLFHRRDRPIIGGFSLGATATMAVLDSAPEDYAGAILLEGTLITLDPTAIAFNQGKCAVTEALLAAGTVAETELNAGLFALIGLAQSDPNGPSPIPGLPPGLTNFQALVFALSTPNPAALNTVSATFIQTAATSLDAFDFANPDRVFANVPVAFNDTFAIRLTRDKFCGLGGERRFTRSVRRFRGDLLLISATQGFGPLMEGLESVFSRASSIRRVTAEGFGHIDPILSADHRRFVDKPILRFARRVLRRH